MNGKLLLGLVAALFVFGEASAQSGNKGSRSSYRSAGSSSKSKQQMRFERDQKTKMVKRIEKEHFAEIRLVREQKNALKDLVEVNYQRLSQLETQMQSQLPQQSVEDVRKVYKAALRKGSNEGEAMSMAMQAASVPEMVQTKVMDLKDQSDLAFQEIADKVEKLLNEEQKQVIMAKREADKKEMMAKEMMDKGESEGEAMMAKDGAQAHEMKDTKMTDTKMMDDSASSNSEKIQKKEMPSVSPSSS